MDSCSHEIPEKMNTADNMRRFEKKMFIPKVDCEENSQGRIY